MMYIRGVRQFLFKPVVHILGAIAVWAFVVNLMINYKNDDVSSQLDRLRTYSLRRFPFDYTTAKTQWRTLFNDKWTSTDNGEGCFGKTSLETDAECKSKRSDLVKDVRKILGCDIYRSPYCNCVNQVLRGIANDLTTVASAAGVTPVVYSNKPTGTFLATAKNMSGRKDLVMESVEDCRYMHHPTYVANEEDNSVIRRSHLLFFFSTVVTGNAVYQFEALIGLTIGFR